VVTAATSPTAGVRRQGSLDVLAWPSLDALGVDAFVTTRHGGVSAGPYATLNLGLHVGDTPADVLVNRRRVAAALGADLGDVVFCNQAHGRRVAVVSEADRGRGAFRLDDAVASTDALVTTDPVGVITDVNQQMEALTGDGIGRWQSTCIGRHSVSSNLSSNQGLGLRFHYALAIKRYKQE